MQHSDDRTVARPSIRSLTALRFVAAMEVVLFHVWRGERGPPQEFDLAYNLASGGHEAVAFFFVLSGFILTYVYSGRDPRDGLTVPRSEFWNSRISRLLPAYFFGLLLMLPAFAYGALVAEVVPMDVFVPGLVLVPVLLQAWWLPAALAWNLPAWSLSVEVFFTHFFRDSRRRSIFLCSSSAWLWAGGSCFARGSPRSPTSRCWRWALGAWCFCWPSGRYCLGGR